MAEPTKLTERYVILDVWRGFALLGVILANMATHSGFFFLSDSQKESLSMASAGGVVEWFNHFLVDGKFYSLFSLLFGIGFALQLSRAGESGVEFKPLFRRRLFILFCIGLLHIIFLYVGDILTVYALVGFALLLFRNVSEKFLLRAVAILLLLPIVQYAFFWIPNMLNPPPPPAPVDPSAPRFFDQLIAQYQGGTFIDIIRNNIGALIFGRWPDLLFTGRFFRVLAMFLLGIYVTRKMIFANLKANRQLLKKVLTWGLVIGIPCNFVLANMMETNAYYSVEPTGIIQPLAYAFGVPALSLAYTAGIALLFLKDRRAILVNIFAPVGRMALTNYLMQSLICNIIFMNYGFAMFGKVGPLNLMFIALTIFLFQIIFSRLWLKRYQFGPMEWLWRSITYRKWQGMKRKPAVEAEIALPV